MTEGHTLRLLVVRSSFVLSHHFKSNSSLFIFHLIITTLLLFTNVHAGPKSVSRTYPVNQNDAWNKSAEACFVSDIDNAFVWSVKHYPGCRDVYGCVVMYEGPEHAMLPGIENITGAYIVPNLVNITEIDLSTLFKIRQNYDNCRYKYSVIIYGNSKLTAVKFHAKWTDIKGEEVFIRANKKLRIEKVTGAFFPVDIGSKTDCSLKMARDGEQCSALVGEFKLNDSFELSSVWPNIRKVYGTITIVNTALTDLSAIRNVKFVDGWSSPALTIVNNSKLTDISALMYMTVIGPKPTSVIKNNPNLCQTADNRRRLERKFGKLKWTRNCLKKCKGGVVTEEYVKSLDPMCGEIEGDLIFRNVKSEDSAEFQKLRRIDRLNGRLIVENTSTLPDLIFLDHLEEINNPDTRQPSLKVSHMENFKLQGLVSLREIHGNVEVFTYRASDVPNSVREQLKKACDGKVTFSIIATTTAAANASNAAKRSKNRIDTRQHGAATIGTNGQMQTGTGMKPNEEKRATATTEEGIFPASWIPADSRHSRDEHTGPEGSSNGNTTIKIVVVVVIVVVIIVLIVAAVIIARHFRQKKKVTSKEKSKEKTPTGKSPASATPTQNSKPQVKQE
ncbi:hypothetical protein Q1695_003639 [Nippostrongylus brasiliensis]|nr:hypothetical protein Q1695_003639 [Nippostrongylus brasiliensis]